MSFCIFNQQRHRADGTQNTATSPMLQRTKFTMRRLTFIFLIFLCGISCNHTKNGDCNFIKTEFYPTGKIRDILSLDSREIKNGQSFFFNEYGFLDSSLTFSNGTLEGLKKIYYDNETDVYEYKNGSLIKHFVYDSLNVLKYETPLDIKKVGITHIAFSNHRNYFDTSKVDTFTITTEGLPAYNRGLMVAGATIERVKNDSTFTLKINSYLKASKKVKIWITARQDIRDTTENAITIDSAIIPMK